MGYQKPGAGAAQKRLGSATCISSILRDIFIIRYRMQAVCRMPYH